MLLLRKRIANNQKPWVCPKLSQNQPTGDDHSVSLTNITVHYILQPVANALSETERSRRFIDDILWITATETSDGRIRQAANFSICPQWFGTNVRQA